jgi:hypothetical protein
MTTFHTKHNYSQCVCVFVQPLRRFAYTCMLDNYHQNLVCLNTLNVEKILTRMMIWADIRSHRPIASSGKRHSPDGVVLFILEYRVSSSLSLDVHSRACTLITHIQKWAPTEAPVDFDLVQDGKVCQH